MQIDDNGQRGANEYTRMYVPSMGLAAKAHS